MAFGRTRHFDLSHQIQDGVVSSRSGNVTGDADRFNGAHTQIDRRLRRIETIVLVFGVVVDKGYFGILTTRQLVGVGHRRHMGLDQGPLRVGQPMRTGCRTVAMRLERFGSHLLLFLAHGIHTANKHK